VLVHADESCLGNGLAPPNPGGNGALVEVRAGDSFARWDFYDCSPNTTNQKMALAGAIATLEWLRRRWQRADVTYVSDSEYLVKGMSEWVKAWETRGWRRKGGSIENLDLWKTLVQVAAAHTIAWQWIRGHDARGGTPGALERVDSLRLRCLARRTTRARHLRQPRSRPGAA
jgi:ribonuclease HI